MSFEVFKTHAEGFASRVNGVSVKCRMDDKGRYIASFSDGTKMIANRACRKVSVQWGSGHRAIVEV